MCAKTLRDELDELDAKLRELLAHPETTQADKASIGLAGLELLTIRRRLMGRWTPVNPATLPPRKPGQPYPQLTKGWMENWEEQREVANA
ncbi:MAG: hypothetical protein KKF77_01320 [Proteobacteria bacterium]|nr:hypothetical protein [Pseudomonadota bacterium]